MLWERAVLGAVQRQDTRTALGAKEFNQTKKYRGWNRRKTHGKFSSNAVV